MRILDLRVGHVQCHNDICTF